MGEEINWQREHLRTEEEAVLCRHMKPRPFMNIGMMNQQFEVPENAQIIGSKKHIVMVQVPIIQGPVIWKLECTSPEILDKTREGVSPALQEQIRNVMVDVTICRFCPFHEAIFQEVI